jgi:transcriptional regulator with GAF, ATPase, and Fis domain
MADASAEKSQAPAPDADSGRLRRERDLYLAMLDLGSQHDLDAFVAEALALIVEVAGAHQGYLEVHEDTDRRGRSWSVAHGFSKDEIAGVKDAVSHGIIAEALATGRTIETPSALLDPRFRERGSVRLSRIEAVLCAPIGDDPPLGVLYLQRRATPGPFPEEERRKIELFARHLAPLADRLLSAERRRHEQDPTREVRESLHLSGVIGRSNAFAACLRQIALVAPLDVSVLLTGESGTGKSQLARVIHDNGPRRNGPFIEVNCASLPDALVEQELFGSLPGAHSTAMRRMEGRVQAAERGTLLLDEIGDLSMAAQGKLLQLLQSKLYYPLGSARPVQADVRVIAATNVDLQTAVREHRFREDLFYRLQVLPVRVPALAERRGDIAELAAYFCNAACERHALRRLTLSRGAVRALEAAAWAGNVRELAHAVQAAAIRADGEGALQVERSHVFPNGGQVTPEEQVRPTFQEATRRFQAQLLRETLEDTNWNIVETARRLDLARSHVYTLIRVFEIERTRP